MAQHPAFQKVMDGAIKNAIDNPNFIEWIRRIVTRLADKSLEKFFQNLIINELVDGQRVRREHMAVHGFEMPCTLVVNPTMACNLHCNGCYASNFSKARHMEYALLHKILTECREIGCRLITVSGGEPLIYKHLFRMLEDFNDLGFLMYTNGTLIDREMARRIAEQGNLWPAISVEGFEAETDLRRGPGIYAQVLEAMKNLREEGVFFGFSATPTRLNSDVMCTDEFLDFYLEQGCLFGWYFTYTPVGLEPDVSLMATPKQRDLLRRKTLEWLVNRPIFIGDFWNNGPYVGGCLSASRYAYITPEGYVQPCTFVHFYTHNIAEHSLVEIFGSPFFRAIRSRQPYSCNLLRPCKILDCPEALQEVVEEAGARPTYKGADQILTNPTVRTFLAEYSREWGELAEKAWCGPEYREGHSVLVPFLGRLDCHERWAHRFDQGKLEELVAISTSGKAETGIRASE